MNLRSKLRDVARQQQDLIASRTKEVRSLKKGELKKLLVEGNALEKSLAEFELMKIGLRKDTKKLMRFIVEETANASFEEALSEAGFKLVGHIEKV